MCHTSQQQTESDLEFLNSFFKAFPQSSKPAQPQFSVEDAIAEQYIAAFESNDIPKIKDKPKIRRFPSGAVRSDDTGRPKPSYFSPYALEAVGELLAENQNDFGATNFWLGIPENKCIDSVMRHYCGYGKANFEGKADLQFKEAVAMLFNIQALVHTMCLKRAGIYEEVHKTTELI